MGPVQVWYASYGSNLARDRFLCYLEGGRPKGATRTYLQVMEENTAARRLYGAAGYAPLYRYYYRTLQR